ncbi:MAG: hypothetical protein U0800_14170 [Isosphaeraceae bacterium]
MNLPFSSRPRPATKAHRRPRTRKACQPGLHALEGRIVLSAIFDSVLSVGNDVGYLDPEDNAVDAAGNTYVTGRFAKTIDFDPLVNRADGSDILTARGTTDAFVAKYAPGGTLVWARRMGSDYVRSYSPVKASDPTEGGQGLAVDGSGNVVVTGHFTGQADFGTITLTGAGSGDVYVAKLNAAGSFLWANRWGGATFDRGNAIAVDADGSVISTGYTAPITSSGGWYADGFEVHKYSPTGAAVWTKRIDNYGGIADGLAADPAGNVYVSGSFSGTADFNPDPKKSNSVTGSTVVSGGQGVNGFVLKLTATGVFAWVSPFVAKTSEVSGSAVYCNDIAVDSAGNVIFGGAYYGQVDFNPSAAGNYRLPTGIGDNSYVTKLSPSGSLVWANRLGGARLRSVAVDSSGAVYTAGAFVNLFEPGFGQPAATSNGNYQAFVTKYSGAGALDWSATFGGPGSEEAKAICIDAAGSIYIAGAFQEDPANPGAADFDPDPVAKHELPNTSLIDIFLLKLRQS